MCDLKEWLTVQKTLLVDSFRFWYFQLRYNASCATDSDREKMEYTLLRETHTIEKGLSLREPRKGFGQQKVGRLLTRLRHYYERFGADNVQFLHYPLATIGWWMAFTRAGGVSIPDLETQYSDLLRMASIQPETLGGYADSIREVFLSEHLQEARGDFSSLLFSRHSVRYFTAEPVSHTVIDEALQLAAQTPSACNRQGWKTHVFEGETCHQLLHWQGGCRGFEQDVHQAIVVTANQKAFLYYEMFQAYVDGGLYAMNLINALHYLGLGTIPLSLGFKQRKLKGLRTFGIPAEEVPIVIIGFGHLPDNYKVAASNRKPISETNTYH